MDISEEVKRFKEEGGIVQKIPPQPTTRKSPVMPHNDGWMDIFAAPGYDREEVAPTEPRAPKASWR